MLADNINVSNRLIGTVIHLDRRSKPLCSTIYVKFDDPKAGNSMMKECLPITARAKRFPSKKGKNTVIAEKTTSVNTWTFNYCL